MLRIVKAFIHIYADGLITTVISPLQAGPLLRVPCKNYAFLRSCVTSELVSISPVFTLPGRTVQIMERDYSDNNNKTTIKEINTKQHVSLSKIRAKITKVQTH